VNRYYVIYPYSGTHGLARWENFATRQEIAYDDVRQQWVTENPHHALEAKRCGLLVSTVEEMEFE
jgi:hypothetical protein